MSSIGEVNFLDDDSLTGKLFYRIFKSQEKNVDTVCCMLAHLMNKFIQELQEGSADLETGANTDKGRSNAKTGGSGQRTEYQYSERATKMYAEFLQALADDLSKDNVLTATNTHFQLKKVWTPEQEEANKNKTVLVSSLRFSDEIGLLVDLLYEKLMKLKSAERVGKATGKNKESFEQVVAEKILGLVFFRMVKKLSQSTDTLQLYLYPYLRETKKQILIDEGLVNHGESFLVLCQLVNTFFSNRDELSAKQDPNWVDLRSNYK